MARQDVRAELRDPRQAGTNADEELVMEDLHCGTDSHLRLCQFTEDFTAPAYLIVGGCVADAKMCVLTRENTAGDDDHAFGERCFAEGRRVSEGLWRLGEDIETAGRTLKPESRGEQFADEVSLSRVGRSMVADVGIEGRDRRRLGH